MLVDVPYTELNHSAFWVEFIVRNQEVPHARSGADELNIIQYFLVDVIAFVMVLIAIALATLIISLKLLLRLVVFLVKFPFCKRETKQSQKTYNINNKNSPKIVETLNDSVITSIKKKKN